MRLIQPIGWGLGINGDGPGLLNLLNEIGDAMDWCHNWSMKPPAALQQKGMTDKWMPTLFGYRWPPPPAVWPPIQYSPQVLPRWIGTPRHHHGDNEIKSSNPSEYWPFDVADLPWIENRALFVFNEPAFGWCPNVIDYRRAAEYYHIVLSSLLRYRWVENLKGREVDILLCSPSENIIGQWYDWLVEFHRILHRNSTDPHFYALHLYSARDGASRDFLEERLKHFIDIWARGTKIVITESSAGPGLIEAGMTEEQAISEHCKAMDWLRGLLDNYDEVVGVCWFAAFDQPSPGSGGTDPSTWNGPLYWGLHGREKLLEHWKGLSK